MEALKRDNYYTYADYASWDDDVRYELIEGVPYAMSSPLRVHQKISVALSYQLYHFLRNKPCEVYSAPFDVRLNVADEDDTIVQPDILVVCDESKLDDKSCKGAPDMIIEILSPSTARHDSFVKFNLYQKAGVREYWIVDSEHNTVDVHLLKDDGYFTRKFDGKDTISVDVLEGCAINMADVFAE